MLAPLILTLQLEAPAEDYFTGLRKQYFPAELNYIGAHLTLFHHLPAHESVIFTTLHQIIKHPVLQLDVTSVKNIGNGTVFTIASTALQAMHKQLQQAFAAFLTLQDKQKLWPHITVQNKVSTAAAKQTTELLNKNFKPFCIKGIGISSWFYLNGPWQKHQNFLFEG